MRDRILKFIYLRYRSTFYHFFDEEFLSDIPGNVREPAMNFLANGRDRLEKWALFQAKFLQRRMVTDIDKIRTYEGMMLMLKLLMVHIDASKVEVRQVGSIETEKAKDPVEEARGAVKSFKEKRTGELSTD